MELSFMILVYDVGPSLERHFSAARGLMVRERQAEFAVLFALLERVRLHCTRREK